MPHIPVRLSNFHEVKPHQRMRKRENSSSLAKVQGATGRCSFSPPKSQRACMLFFSQTSSKLKLFHSPLIPPLPLHYPMDIHRCNQHPTRCHPSHHKWNLQSRKQCYQMPYTPTPTDCGPIPKYPFLVTNNDFCSYCRYSQ